MTIHIHHLLFPNKVHFKLFSHSLRLYPIIRHFSGIPAPLARHASALYIHVLYTCIARLSCFKQIEQLGIFIGFHMYAYEEILLEIAGGALLDTIQDSYFFNAPQVLGH